jgi:hypothetical protein
MVFRTPWESDPVADTAPMTPPEAVSPPKRRGRRPAFPVAATKTNASPGWLYHHLTITGPAEAVVAFAAAARGSGVIPWQLDYDVIEEDVFNLAVAQPVERRTLTVEGCRILARQFRERVEARQTRAAALVGRSRACPFDLQALLPVPPAILRRGPTDPASLAWLSRHWGTTDGLRQVVEREKPTTGRRLPAGQTVAGYGFFTGGGVAQGSTGNSPWNGNGGETPHTAIAQIGARWPALRFVLRPRPPN